MRGRASGFGARISSMVGLLIVAVIETASSNVVVGSADLGLDERDLVLGQPVSLVELASVHSWSAAGRARRRRRRVRVLGGLRSETRKRTNRVRR